MAYIVVAWAALSLRENKQTGNTPTAAKLLLQGLRARLQGPYQPAWTGMLSHRLAVCAVGAAACCMIGYLLY